MPESEPQQRRDDHDSTRMTLGEHLDELRGCAVRSLLVLFVACLACIWPAKYLLSLIARPMVLALREHGQTESFLQTSPVETILVYVKVVVIFGLIIGAPYIIHQLWRFVGAGLYPHEKKWVYKLVPPSVGLFLTGVLFMYVFVLVVSLNFLVGFSGWLPLPNPRPNALERMLLGHQSAEVAQTQPAESAPVIPLLAEDPNEPADGAIWFNAEEGKLKVRSGERTQSVQLKRDDRRALVTTHFKIGEYLSFVLIMTIAFGLAFQVPLVVLFLARTGIVPVQTFRSYRKVVILVIVIIAGILAPPDLFSHLLLSAPMYLLFEAGLALASRSADKAPTKRGAAGAD